MYPDDPIVRRQLQLQLQVQDAVHGLAEFTLAVARPAGWLNIELLATPAARACRPDGGAVVVSLAHRRATRS